jgi:type II secretory pathway pseudopilin PulG
MATPHAAPVHPQQGNGMAVAGMVLGILGLALCWLPFVGWLCALLGIILGGLGMSKAKQVAGKGKGMAIAGLICGLLGLLIGVMLFVLATMAVSSFDSYVKKSKRSEASLQLRSLETKIKTFHMEKSTLPNSASVMPAPISELCSSPGNKLAKKPYTAWDAAGWRDIGFHLDEDSRYSYEWVKKSETEGEAIATTDLDCNGTPSVTKMTIRRSGDGNLTAEYSEPTEE